MKLVIEIPDEVYDRLKTLNSHGMATGATMYILNGKPLPKGHGRLIDGNKLLNKWDNMSVGRTEFDQVIMCMPTIIEADKENK